MSAPKLLAIVVGSIMLFGGVAAVSAAGPGEMSADNAPADETVPAEAADQAANADEQAAEEDKQSDVSDERADRAGNTSVGPSDGLPEQAPDHVSEIHETIDAFLDGSVDNLGEALNDALGAGEEADNGDSVAEEDDSDETESDEDDSEESESDETESDEDDSDADDADDDVEDDEDAEENEDDETAEAASA